MRSTTSASVVPDPAATDSPGAAAAPSSSPTDPPADDGSATHSSSSAGDPSTTRTCAGDPSTTHASATGNDAASSVRLEHVTVRFRTGEGTSAVVGPLTVTVDRSAITFLSEPTRHSRRLPWDRVRSVGVADDPLGGLVTITTAAAIYQLLVPDLDADAVVDLLTPWLPTTTARPPVEPPAGPAEPPAGPAVTRSTFDRLRPVLAVILVLAVATMAALVLAVSTGAVHLAWLGGTGAGRTLPPNS